MLSVRGHTEPILAQLQSNHPLVAGLCGDDGGGCALARSVIARGLTDFIAKPVAPDAFYRILLADLPAVLPTPTAGRSDEGPN